MDKLTSILVVIDPRDDTHNVLTKALLLARQSRAHLELFLCDSDQAHQLRHAYDTRGVAAARRDSITTGERYLDSIRRALPPDIVSSTHVACESPLYEALVHRVLESGVDLVMKRPAGLHPLRRVTLDANDWELARTCPVPLMLTRGRAWRTPARFVAAIDSSHPDGAELARTIVHTAGYLVQTCGAQLGVVFSDREEGDAADHWQRSDAFGRLVNEFLIAGEQVHLLHGEAADTIPDFITQDGCDVLVLGALTHRNELAALMGTLTAKLVDQLECDFVLVKPESYACPVALRENAAAG